MRLRIGPTTYTVVLVQQQLRRDGERVAALTHRRQILISGELDPCERLECLADQCRRLWRQHFGTLKPEGFAAFFVMLSRQLVSQGGERAIELMQPGDKQDRRAA